MCTLTLIITTSKVNVTILYKKIMKTKRKLTRIRMQVTPLPKHRAFLDILDCTERFVLVIEKRSVATTINYF